MSLTETVAKNHENREKFEVGKFFIKFKILQIWIAHDLIRAQQEKKLHGVGVRSEI